MLVLSRNRNEAVLIPGVGIEIRVVDIRGDKIRLGITAPDDLKIYREEVWERVLAKLAQEQRLASGDEAEQESAAA